MRLEKEEHKVPIEKDRVTQFHYIYYVIFSYIRIGIQKCQIEKERLQKYVKNLSHVDDIAVFAERSTKLDMMIHKIANESELGILEMNTTKTKILRK